MEKVICKICNSKAEVIARNHISYIENVHFDIYHCPVCDTNFVDDKHLDINIYQHIYAQSNFIGGYNRYLHYAETIVTQKDPWHYITTREPMYWSVKKAIKDLNITKNDSILEIGSGLGYLTYALAKTGYKITGVDISQNAVDAANKRFGNYFIAGDIFVLCKQPTQLYDFIIMNEVIEHVPDPKAFIECAVSMLKPNGKLIVTTPDKSVSIPGQPWDTELPPVHLWWFSDKSMLTIAKQLSYKINFIDFTNFNKYFFDKMRFKIYKPYRRDPTLNSEGKVISPQKWQAQPSSKLAIQNTISWFASIPGLNNLLTRKEYPIKKNNTLAVIFSK